MKILIVCPKLSHGGAERVGVVLANGLSLDGHEVTVASNLYEEVTYELDQQVQVFNLVGKSKRASLKWLSAIRILRNHIKSNRPDVIIGIMQLSSFVGKVAQMGMNIPVVMTEHDSFERPNSAPFTKMQYFCKYYLNRIYTHVTVLTQSDKLLADKHLKRVTVMPNPLAIPTVSKSEITDLFNKKENIILASGRLYDWHVKGFDILIKSFGLMMKDESLNIKDSGWRLQISGVGSEEDVAFLKNLCKENGVGDSVDFLGFVSDVRSLYQKASVFVLSSRYEGFGLVLIEAMSQGCACVACDYKGRQMEIMGLTPTLSRREGESPVEIQKCGILCEPNNVDDLASAISEMVKNESRRKELSINAVKRADFYSIEQTIDRWEELLNTVTDKC